MAINLTDPHSADILLLPEKSRISLQHHLRFRARMERENPDACRLLCHHGKHIGFNGLFADNCEWCNLEGG